MIYSSFGSRSIITNKIPYNYSDNSDFDACGVWFNVGMEAIISLWKFKSCMWWVDAVSMGQSICTRLLQFFLKSSPTILGRTASLHSHQKGQFQTSEQVLTQCIHFLGTHVQSSIEQLETGDPAQYPPVSTRLSLLALLCTSLCFCWCPHRHPARGQGSGAELHHSWLYSCPF